MSVKSALCSCLSLALPLLALPVAAHNETLAPGLSARLHLATSWRSDDQQTEGGAGGAGSLADSGRADGRARCAL